MTSFRSPWGDQRSTVLLSFWLLGPRGNPRRAQSHPEYSVTVPALAKCETECECECEKLTFGQLELELRDRTVTVNPGEFFIVPKGVEHKPIAKEETHLLLFEPLSTKHTGDVMADITVETYEQI